MNIIVQFKPIEFVLFTTIEKKIFWIQQKTERELLDYLILHPNELIITENEKKKILKKLEKNENIKSYINNEHMKYPVQYKILKMSENLKHFNVFKTR